MTGKVPLLDLHAQYRSIESELRAALEKVFASQHFILGPEVEALEKEIAPYVGCQHGIGVTSGSDALLVSLMVLGVGPGDEVITVPHTFFATVGAISRLGAKPVFVDVEPTSFNMDPKKLEKAFTSRTKALIPVHLFGQAADMAPIVDLCKKRNVPIIEDAAQAIGTEYQGKRVGTFGTTCCFSFFPSKNLGAMGDGGMVTTNDPDLAEKLRIYRGHGSKPKYYHKYVGGNFRLDALQAAILRVKFKHLDSWTKKRQENADRYDRLFKDAGLEKFVTLPWRRKGDRHIFNQYVIRGPKRDELKKHLTEKGVGTEIYYPLPLHLQECFRDLGHKTGDFPESEKAANDSMAVPIYPELTPAQQEQVVGVIREFYLR
ncbi:MAG: DegT/DnrJ/EryC1/StrS family aminotransferase [Pseudomonadota bacterium]